jgi:hypothetical protein
MTARDAGGAGESLCPRDLPSIVEAIRHEIAAALKWGFDVADEGSLPRFTEAEQIAECAGTWELLPAGAETGGAWPRVNRLYRNRPNPFARTTEIRFSLAEAGPVVVAIYDVNGRLVRTLVDRGMEAGLHSLTWDGRNDSGKPVGSGIYWSRMRASSFVSNKKLVGLR